MELVNILTFMLLGFPLLGFFLVGLIGKKLPYKVSAILASIMVFASFAISVFLFVTTKESSYRVVLFHWFHITQWNIDLSFVFDHLSLLMLLIITGVGFLIHIYSIGYMKGDEDGQRFFSYLNLFVFFMIFLVTGSNFLLMFIGWEGVGLCSYLLIGFWSQNTAYNLAAKKAFVMNRIGDVGLVLAIFYILEIFNTLEFDQVNAMANSGLTSSSQLTIITLLLFLAATGKSAQMPLFTWLPDAMAGPTPVSALIHAATMVTAGIYMVIRNHVLFLASPITMQTIMWIGAATCLFGALVGIKQNDIKKVLAYSTVSQLGLLFVALGSGAFVSSFFHLTTHAFFKALLFLGAGSVIHAMGGEQDIRKMGGLRKHIPVTFWVFMIGTLAISGIPPFSGFFSKDEILEHVYAHDKIAYVIIQLASLITVFYMFRLTMLVFFGEFRGTDEARHHLHESPSVMTLPLIILAILSVVGGLIGLPHYTGVHHWLEGYLGESLKFPVLPEVETYELFMLIGIAVGGALLVMVLAIVMYGRMKVRPEKEGEKMNVLAILLANKFYVDELYHYLVKIPVNFLSKNLYRFIDNGLIDKLVNLTGITALSSGLSIRKVQSGNTGLYLFIMTMAMIGLVLLQFLLR